LPTLLRGARHAVEATQTVLVGHELPVYRASYSPDGKRIVTASLDKTARVWDAETGRQIAVLEGHEMALYSAAFSPPDGAHIVTVGADDTARVWDAKTGAQEAVLRHPTVSKGRPTLPTAGAS